MIAFDLVGRTLNAVAAGMLLATLAWLLLRWLGPQNSSTRFAVWFTALLAIVALPFVPALAAREVLSGRAPLTLPGSVAVYLAAAWALIASVLLLRIAVALAHVRRIRRNSIEVDVAILDPALCAVLPDSASRRVQLRISEEVRVPAAIGFFRPAIIVPGWAWRELPLEDLKSILLHEAAHLHRWDDWTNLAQKLAKALFFFHPAVWWIESRLSLEREMACDDIVLAHSGSPRNYAASLVSLAERVHMRRGLELMQAALGRVRDTSLRIARILDVDRPSATRVWRPVLIGVLVISAGSLVAAPYAPEFIAFQGTPKVEQQVASRVANPSKSLAPAETLKVKPGSSRLDSATVTPVRLKVTQKPGPTLRANYELKAAQVLMFEQTASYDASGASVVTLCVWRVDPQSGQRQLESAIVMRSL